MFKKSKQTSKNFGIFLDMYDRDILKLILSFVPLNQVVLYQDLTKKYRVTFDRVYCSIVKDVALVGNRQLQNLISNVYSYNGCFDCGMEKVTRVPGHMVDCGDRYCSGFKCPKECIYGCYICTIKDDENNNNKKCSECVWQCEQCFEYVCKEHYANCNQCAQTRIRCDHCTEKCMRSRCKNKIKNNTERIRVPGTQYPYRYRTHCKFHYCKECRSYIEGRMFKKRGPSTRPPPKYGKDGTRKGVGGETVIPCSNYH